MLSSEEEHQYTSIIDAILATANLETVTRKKIRQGLERALHGKDLSEYKNEIKALIEARFDAFREEPTSAPVAIPTPPSASAVSDDKPHFTPKREHSSTIKYEEDEKEANGEIQVSVSQPPAKKQKRNSIAAEDADARLAAELQAQENRLARGRTTRGGGPVKPKKKAPKKKSASRVKNDDSDAAGSDLSGTPKEKRKAGGGFQKPFNLSAPLAEVCGAPQMSRPQVVKHLWQHIKGNELQDPSNKKQIICDDMMQAVFKQSRVDMFQMNKLLGDHLYPIDE